MALAQLQLALTRLFTDAALRDAFVAAPEAVARRLDLNAEDAAIVSALDPRAVEEFGDCLLRKRILDARKTLPLTAAALGEDFNHLMRAAIQVPPRTGRHRDDAREFTRRLVAEGTIRPAWIIDLARYEMAFVEFQSPGTRLVLRHFRFPVGAIAKAIMVGAPPQNVARRAGFGVWLRLGRARPLNHWLV